MPPEQSETYNQDSTNPSAELPDAGQGTLRHGPTSSTPGSSSVHQRHSQLDDMQRSPSPADEVGAVKYTRTGRVSKATKGRRIHHCDECDKTYTRAEHLRRHQQNHKPGAFPCDIPGCGRSFFREDLLARHKARHNDPHDPPTRRASIGSEHSTADVERSFVPSDQQGPAAFPHAVAGADHDTDTRPDDVPQDVSANVLQHSTATRISGRKPGYIPINELPPQAPIAVDSGDLHAGYPIGTLLEPSPPYSPIGYGCPTEDFAYLGGPYFDQPQLACARAGHDAEYLHGYEQSSSSRSPVSMTSSSCYLPQCGPAGTRLSIGPYIASSSSSDDAYCNGMYTNVFGNQHFVPLAQNGATRMMSAEERDTLEIDQLVVPMAPPPRTFNESLFPNEQRYLASYWTWIHPLLPVVHKPSFDAEKASPLLKSAMLALGADMLQEATDLSNARLTHERCVKVLKKRTISSWHTYRVCDMQAILLIEVYFLFKSRRPPLQVSKDFEDVYRRLTADADNFNYGGSISPHDSRVSDLFDEVSIPDAHSIERQCKQRLLIACYVLDQQQATFFGRQRADCMTATMDTDLPWPASQSSWDALWDEQAQLDCYERATDTFTFTRVSEPLYSFTSTSDVQYDAFQSQLLLACLSDQHNDRQAYGPNLDDLNLPNALERTPRTELAYHTAMLCKHTPVRDLLAVSGESWIMAEKLGSQDEYTRSQIAARDWAIGSRGALTISQCSADQAFHHALRILDIQSQYSRTGLLYQEWAVYLAAVVIWARAYVLDVKRQKMPRVAIPSPVEPRANARKLDQAVTNLINNGFAVLGWTEAQKVLLWTKAQIERVDVAHNCGLTNSALDVLGKLCTRGNEDGWFG